MIYINLAHHRQSWRQFEFDHHSSFLDLLGSSRQEMDLESSLCSQVSLLSPDGSEWVLPSVTTCSAKGKLHQKSIKCMLLCGNIQLYVVTKGIVNRVS